MRAFYSIKIYTERAKNEIIIKNQVQIECLGGYLQILRYQQLVQHILIAEWLRSNYTNRVTLVENHLIGW